MPILEKEKRHKLGTGRRKPPQPLPKWNVILLDDDEHSRKYIMGLLKDVLGYTETDRAEKKARTVKKYGRSIVLTTHKELAELKKEQIMARGPDETISGSTTSMKAIIEPAAK